MMYRSYLVTGATGFLGSAVVKRLTQAGQSVRALVLPGDPQAARLPPAVEQVSGGLDRPETLEALFRGAGEGTCVIHCAGLISIASHTRQGMERLWKVNVEGTRAVARLSAQRGVSKLVYVSSVHAIPELPDGKEMAEPERFDPALVEGDYAKTKAAATASVLEAAARGLNASVVHPAGIIGPEDSAFTSSITATILSYCKGKLPMGVKGGYNFVDVRDVADGVLACAERGRRGECYILSNRYVSVREVLETLRGLVGGRKVRWYAPLRLAGLIAPLCERQSRRRGRPPFLTPYSVYTLGTNSAFSWEKAAKELGYRPREIAETLSDTAAWLAREGRIPALS